MTTRDEALALMPVMPQADIVSWVALIDSAIVVKAMEGRGAVEIGVPAGMVEAVKAEFTGRGFTVSDTLNGEVRFDWASEPPGDPTA